MIHCAGRRKPASFAPNEDDKAEGSAQCTGKWARSKSRKSSSWRRSAARGSSCRWPATRKSSKLPWLIPHFATEEGRLKMSIHSLVVETPTRRIVVDTGLGNDKQGRNVPTWNNRQDAVPRNHDGRRVLRPTASTPCCARICMSTMSAGTPGCVDGNGCRPSPMRAMCSAETEYEHWRDHSDEPDKAAVFDDSVKPIVDAGKADLVASDARLADEITLIPTPGHSPGHMSVHIRSDGEEAPAHRRRRPSSLPDGASRLVVDRRFRSRAVGGDAARTVLALRRYADAGDRRAFQRRPPPARRRCLQIHRLGRDPGASLRARNRGAKHARQRRRQLNFPPPCSKKHPSNCITRE